MTIISTMASTVLATYAAASTERVLFDPNNPTHRIAYRNFADTGRWTGGCPFKLEWPFLTVPALCQSRVLDYYFTQDNDLSK